MDNTTGKKDYKFMKGLTDLFPHHLTSCTANDAVRTEAASTMQSTVIRFDALCWILTTGSVGSGGRGQLLTWKFKLLHQLYKQAGGYRSYRHINMTLPWLRYNWKWMRSLILLMGWKVAVCLIAPCLPAGPRPQPPCFGMLTWDSCK